LGSGLKSITTPPCAFPQFWKNVRIHRPLFVLFFNGVKGRCDRRLTTGALSAASMIRSGLANKKIGWS
jgi:hypothetical protein